MADGKLEEHFTHFIPDGDNRERRVCDHCGFIHYDNPRVIVGVVCTWDDRFLLCRRAIDPRKGYWTLPAGFLEIGETAAAGAEREAWEEARARLEIDSLLAVYDVTHIGQVQLIYRARLISPEVSAGPESEEVELVTWDAIPWTELAFPTVSWALHAYRRLAGQSDYQPDGNPAAGL